MSEREQPMRFPDRRAGARMQRLALTTAMVRGKDGKMTLVNRHPHERVRVFRGPCRAT